MADAQPEPDKTSPRRVIFERYDLVVVGAGAAGLSVAYGAARFGLKVALLERGEMGGECLNAGCVPSKALLAAARRGLDWDGVTNEIRRAMGTIAPSDSQARYEGLGVTVIRGAARFLGKPALAVGERNILGRHVVVAAGSRPLVPAFLAHTAYLTNETVWSLARKPESLVILGAGPMGLEMADAFSSLGTTVTVVAGDQVLAREDPELTAPVVAALRAKGVAFAFSRAVSAAAGALVLADGRNISADKLLLAAGRTVDIADLNPQAAGLVWGPNGIRTDRRLRAVGHKRIFAAGDVADPEAVGPQRLTHVAGSHASVILRQICFALPARVSAPPPARVMFTSPELAQVGFSLAQAGPGARALVQHFSENDRAICEGDTAGLVKLVIDRRARLIGAGIVGPGAGEMIALYALAVARKMKISALAGLTLPYPTRAEAGKRAAGAFLAATIFGPAPRLVARLMARLR